MMEIGVVGKPNVGKSTFFSSCTKAPAEIANYPFTTIDANMGVAFVNRPCPHKEFNVQCQPRNSECDDGMRRIPIQILDVAGLVPGAFEGKGLGNKFLDDLRQATALIHIVDASGSTDLEGNPVEIGEHDPMEDVKFLEYEVRQWIIGIIKRGWEKISRKIDLTDQSTHEALHEQLTGLGVSEKDVLVAMRGLDLPEKTTLWTDEHIEQLARNIQNVAKPIIIAANKADIAPKENMNKLEHLNDYIVIPTSAECELALSRASEAGLIEYHSGESTFEVLQSDKLNGKQKEGLEQIEMVLDELGGTGVQRCLEEAAFNMLDLIAVFPVEDENKLTDKEGRVLPDAFLLPDGSTAIDLAYKVHSDLGDNFIRAINARSKRVVGREYKLKDGDIISIVAKV